MVEHVVLLGGSRESVAGVKYLKHFDLVGALRNSLEMLESKKEKGLPCG